MAQQNKNKKGSGHNGQLVKYTKGKHKFEVISNTGSVLKYRDGKLDFGNVLMVDKIFTNSTRGDIANASDLMAAFGTEDIQKCLEVIIKNGELQYSPQERKQFVEAKTNEVIYYINKNYVNPKSKLPHPSDRIANCLKECKIRIDPNGDTRRMAEDAVKKMRGKLMFAKAVMLKALLTIKHAQVGKCTNLIHKVANVIHEEWTGIGCVFTVELSKADLNTLQAALMKPTNGDYEMSFLNDDAAGGFVFNDNDANANKKKKKKDKKNKKKHKSNYNSNITVSNTNNDNNTPDNDKKKKKKKKKKKNKYADNQ